LKYKKKRIHASSNKKKVEDQPQEAIVNNEETFKTPLNTANGVLTRSQRNILVETKPKPPELLPFEISTILHEKGYPKVAMKYAHIIPQKRETIEPLFQEQPSPDLKPKKHKNHQKHSYTNDTDEFSENEMKDDRNLLDLLIPVSDNYIGTNNPFNMGSAECQRQARNLICNRRLQQDDLTKWRNKLKKRKNKLLLEESRQLWRASHQSLDNKAVNNKTLRITNGNANIVKTKKLYENNQLKGKVVSPDGNVQYLMELR
jgi:hypothetical protein